MKSTTFSQIVDGYLLAANARRLSDHTIRDYVTTFKKFNRFLDDDPPFESITVQQVENFLAHQNVSKKTILNYHIGLSALWTWAIKEELVEEHIIRRITRVKPEKKAIKPYTEDDIRTMLNVINQTNVYSRPGKRDSFHRLPHADRNRAIIYILLDTGVRVSELINLNLHEVDLRNRRMYVMGKGSKERTIPFSPKTGQVIWKYLTSRKDASLGEYLFTNNEGGELTRSRVLRILRTIGQRAGVMKVTVHRFRHTFAINYLRNGGDAYSLQMMLGHSTMEMVKTYLALAQADLDKNHKLASPVDNWRL
ncbi:MAG: tyrosine-type recombinase/integrase [Anaerolineales bacterium]|nr:tyrosine-type recombinase/integrase [Anaerolineales bacterium]